MLKFSEIFEFSKGNSYCKNSNGSNGSNGSVPRRSNLSTLVRPLGVVRSYRLQRASGYVLSSERLVRVFFGSSLFSAHTADECLKIPERNNQPSSCSAGLCTKTAWSLAGSSMSRFARTTATRWATPI